MTAIDNINLLFDVSLFEIQEAAAQRCLFCKSLLEKSKNCLASVELLYSPCDLFLCVEIRAHCVSKELKDSIGPFGLWSKKDSKLAGELAFVYYSIFATPGMSILDPRLSHRFLELRVPK
jgi:hypothetical protein